MELSNVLRVVTVGLLLCASTRSARAALPIEFEFGGVFTQTTGTVHQVGDRFTTTVRFDREAVDVEPSPVEGKYPYISWIVPGRFADPTVFNNTPVTIGRIRVLRANPSVPNVDQWRLQFTGAGSFGYGIVLEYPPGTFPTDELPLSLSLSQAFTRDFAGGDTDFTLRGSIDSLTVRVVPDPTGAASLSVLALVGARRRR